MCPLMLCQIAFQKDKDAGGAFRSLQLDLGVVSWTSQPPRACQALILGKSSQ